MERNIRTAEPGFRADAVAVREGTASVRWNGITRDFISAKPAAAKEIVGHYFDPKGEAHGLLLSGRRRDAHND